MGIAVEVDAIGQYLFGESFVRKKMFSARFRARTPLDPASASNEFFVYEIARRGFPFQTKSSPTKYCLISLTFPQYRFKP